MKNLSIASRRLFISFRQWANTERGERTIVSVLGALLVLLIGILSYLLVGVICYYTNADWHDVLLIALTLAVLVQMWCAMLNN